jgi:hypothetical protein
MAVTATFCNGIFHLSAVSNELHPAIASIRTDAIAIVALAGKINRLRGIVRPGTGEKQEASRQYQDTSIKQQKSALMSLL